MLDFTIYGLNINIRYKQLLTQIKKQIQLCSIRCLAVRPSLWLVWLSGTHYRI